jgi:hypothetical protein
MNNFDDKVLIGTTMSDGEFEVYAVLNNNNDAFGSRDTPRDPSVPTFEQVITLIVGAIAANRAAQFGTGFDDEIADIEVHRACSLTQMQVPDCLDQLDPDNVGDRICENDDHYHPYEDISNLADEEH